MPEADPFPDVDRTEVDPDAMAAYASEREFMALAAGLLREAAAYACIAAGTLGPEPAWTRDRAVVGGNAVRLSKLLSALLDQVCQGRGEIAAILGRLVFETAVNLRYLLADPGPPLLRSYIRHSLRHERGLRDRIRSNIAERGGGALPIEERMLRSLDRAARTAGIALEEVDPRESAPWGGKHLRQKAEAVGWGDPYHAFFGGLSHNVHGAWQDLYSHHLEADEAGRFTPDFGWTRPRPQLAFALGTLVVEVVRKVFGFLGGAPALELVGGKLADLGARIREADGAHERYLSEKQRPIA